MLYFRRLGLLLVFIIYPTIFNQQLTAQDSGVSNGKPYVSRITSDGDFVIYSSEPGENSNHFLEKEIVLGFRKNSFAIELKPENSFDYQFFLDGLDLKPSSWQKRNFKEYTNLPSGQYTLHVWFRSSYNKPVEAAKLSVRVKPLWFFSWLAILFYLVLFFLIIWVLYEHLELKFARKQYMLEQIINKRTEDLIIEKEKTEALLANVLPKNTADEIMAKGKATKIKYNFVTVLFSDIQGFTQIAEEMNPEILIDELDKFFFHFDSVVEKFKIEEIKTIGDAYMCAGGIPEKNRTNPVEVILAALEMQLYMKKLKETSVLAGMKYWDIRIGIHTGTVIAGVVGQKKLSYDIWGDTVNTASRMESSGEAGKINISGTTYEFVKDFFICEHRGKMPVKYKGELDMYFIESIVPDLRDEEGVPNHRFLVKLQLIKLQDVEELINKMFVEDAPPNLYFHNAAFARNICSHVDLLATAESLPDEVFVNLKLASIFLISGFISDYDKPLEAAFLLVEEILPRYGFNEKNIDATRQIISNSFNKKYESISDKILHDARYDYIGRVDYIKLTDKLLRERRERGIITDSRTWIDIQKKLLIEHVFLTGTGRLLRSVSVEDQIAELQIYNK